MNLGAPTTVAHYRYLDVQPAADRVSLVAVARHLFALMLRNMSTSDFMFVHPAAGTVSAPGSVLASPSHPDPPVPDGTPGPQDYVYNWTRDAAIGVLELTAPTAPLSDAERAGRMGDWIDFVQTCQANAPRDGDPDAFARACFTLEGRPRAWSNQTDGPALQTLALLEAFPLVDDAARTTAARLIAANVAYLLEAYTRPTKSLWEEERGLSFFARAVQLRSFATLADNPHGLPVPAGIAGASDQLAAVLQRHWCEDRSIYLSFEPPWEASDDRRVPYDPNIDIVLAALYGTVPAASQSDPMLNPRLLASAAAVRHVWTAGAARYPINAEDAERGLGPLLGRYPGDYYDGDTDDPNTPGHPWALCTSALAELYYKVAMAIEASSTVPADPMATPFFTQVDAVGTPAQVAAALRGAGDRMLRAIVFHSSNLELSEQFDATTGFERSLTNLTWSYASFLSAVRARGA